MTHPGYRPEDPQQQYPPQSPAYPGYPPPPQPQPQPTGSWPATSTPPYAVSGAPPAVGAPYGEQQRGRAPMLVAVVAAVALFLLAGVMTGLYVAKSSQLGDTRETLNKREQTIVANNEKITKLESDLETANSELTKSKESLTDVTKERDVLLPCMRRFVEALDSVGNDAALETALRQATTACQKAQAEVE
jgi:hypothetical protein